MKLAYLSIRLTEASTRARGFLRNALYLRGIKETGARTMRASSPGLKAIEGAAGYIDLEIAASWWRADHAGIGE